MGDISWEASRNFQNHWDDLTWYDLQPKAMEGKQHFQLQHHALLFWRRSHDFRIVRVKLDGTTKSPSWPVLNVLVLMSLVLHCCGDSSKFGISEVSWNLFIVSKVYLYGRQFCVADICVLAGLLKQFRSPKGHANAVNQCAEINVPEGKRHFLSNFA